MCEVVGWSWRCKNSFSWSFSIEGLKISQERQRETLKRNGSGTPIKKRSQSLRPRRCIGNLSGAMLILSVSSYATLPEREQRNSMNYRYFSTRLPGGHVENYRPQKRFLIVCCRTRFRRPKQSGRFNSAFQFTDH